MAAIIGEQTSLDEGVNQAFRATAAARSIDRSGAYRDPRQKCASRAAALR
jgi:hypothetical protein